MVDGAKLGVDWCTATRAQLEAATSSWTYSRKQLGALLLDQHIIAGIGVAWGSEILREAGHLRPELPAKIQSLCRLVEAMCAVRDKAWAVYVKAVDECPDKVQFVNDWFENLYSVRAMEVYGKTDGSCETVKAGARMWWVCTAATRAKR
jgi:formamidopyrimidine-DNA glycosylase